MFRVIRNEERQKVEIVVRKTGIQILESVIVNPQLHQKKSVPISGTSTGIIICYVKVSLAVCLSSFNAKTSEPMVMKFSIQII